ncbi:MAG TPA: DUF6600 domain-containing protein [Rhizomicrobium sp.]|nr:DUF6600 domain-containing protein [Rhizomicrobium sp.]
MLRPLRARLLAGSIALGFASIAFSFTPAAAQHVDVSVGFNTFHDNLSRHGDWVYSDRWGEVWTPTDVRSDFRPYQTGGHWAYTDEYGWTWVSDYEWGDIAFHYGRWVNDPDDGWLWIPGYVWSPGWVVWRTNDRYTGWMPMPPDEQFLRGPQGNATAVGISVGGGGLSFSVDFNNTGDYYGYSRWYGRDYDQNRFASNWMFVDTGHMADRDYSRYQAPRSNYVTLISNTRNVTNYTIVNNYVVNRSVDVHAVERAGGHPVRAMRIDAVIHNPQFVAKVDVGRQAEMRAHDEAPRGTGEAGSAPKPPPQVIQSLSPTVKARNGRAPAHLFTRDTVEKAPLAPAPAGATAPGGENPAGMPKNNNPAGANPQTGAPTGAPGEANPAGKNPPGATTREKMRQHGNENLPANEANPQPGAPTGTPSETNHGATVREKMRHHGDVNAPTGTPVNPTPPSGSMEQTPGAATPPATNEPGGTPDTGRKARHRANPTTGTPDNGAAGGSTPTQPPAETPRTRRERNAPAAGQEPSPNGPPPAADTPPDRSKATGGDTGTSETPKHGKKKPKSDEPGAPPQ